MRKPEQRCWDYLSRAMAGLWVAQRHEDEYSTDIPDVSFSMDGTDGWLELKTISFWPKKGGPVNVDTMRPGQVSWLEDRGRAGNGKCFVLLAVGGNMGTADWVLIHHTMVRHLFNRRLDREYLMQNCYAFSGAGLRDHLAKCLMEDWTERGAAKRLALTSRPVRVPDE